MATADSIATSVEYRDIPGFPGYRVGNDGSVWSCWTRRGLGLGRGRGSQTYTDPEKWQRMKPSQDGFGYMRLMLQLNGVVAYRRVHSLVALAFYGPRPAGMQVAHENGIPTDNRAANLSYKTVRANQADRLRHGTDQYGERNPHAKLTAEHVVAIRAKRTFGPGELDELAREFGVTRSAIRAVVRRESWAHI